MKKTLAYLPYIENPNSYISRMCEILENRFEVVKFPSIKQLLIDTIKLKRGQYDYLVVNWIENKIVTKSGYPSILGGIVLLLQTLLYRIWVKKLIFVRHNHYPHNTHINFRKFIKILLNIYEKLFDVCITHSGAELNNGKRKYCPHPLFNMEDLADIKIPNNLIWEPGYFIVFGRIEPYKQIHRLIEKFPPTQRLLVIGSIGNQTYVNDLLAMQSSNIKIAPGRISDGIAQQLIKQSAGMLISHAEEDMVVSGSFFYALSILTPLYVIETPYIKWIAQYFDKDYLHVAQDLTGFVRLIEGYTLATLPVNQIDITTELFGDKVVESQFLSAVDID